MPDHNPPLLKSENALRLSAFAATLRTLRLCVRQVFLLSSILPCLAAGCIASRVMDSQDRKAYSDYRIKAEENNTQRQKAGLAPTPVPTFEEWRGTKK